MTKAGHLWARVGVASKDEPGVTAGWQSEVWKDQKMKDTGHRADHCQVTRSQQRRGS